MDEDTAALARFSRGDIDLSTFSHREHVHMAFAMLRRHDFAEAAHRVSCALRLMTQRAGKPQAFHQTITVAFLSLVAERMDGCEYSDFATFAAANPDLLDNSVLKRWYRPERLAGDVARRTFVLPDEQASCAPHVPASTTS